MKRSYLPLAVAVIAGVTLLVAGPGARAELWHFRTVFAMLKYAAYGGVAATVLALLFLLIPRTRHNHIAALVIALSIGLVVVLVPWSFQQRARSVPSIHDITTDTDRPPEFVAVLPLRANAPNPPEYGGPEVAAQQKQAYPDIRPLQLSVSPDSAFALARAAIEDEDWELVAADPSEGRLEATATTTFFGFKDDVVVRVQPSGQGSRIDVRSVSRVGRGDAGANAARIRDYLETVNDLID